MELVRATVAEAFERDALSHAEWGSGLTVGAHQARERTLRQGAWARAALEIWFLRDGAEVLASCETYAVPCTVGSEPGRAFLLASVLTEPRLRGRGHATRMLTLLADRLAAEPGAAALVLFSDVGAALYERLGYVALPAIDRVFAPTAGDPDDGAWTRFSETTLAAVWPSVRLPGGTWSIHPSVDQLDWHLDRARTFAERTGRARPSRCGAVLGDAITVWVDDPQADELVVLFHAGDPATLEAATRTASAAGLARVRAWDAPRLSDRAPAPRTGAIPMVRPLRAGLDPRGLGPVQRALWV